MAGRSKGTVGACVFAFALVIGIGVDVAPPHFRSNVFEQAVHIAAQLAQLCRRGHAVGDGAVFFHAQGQEVRLLRAAVFHGLEHLGVVQKHAAALEFFFHSIRDLRFAGAAVHGEDRIPRGKILHARSHDLLHFASAQSRQPLALQRKQIQQHLHAHAMQNF